MKRIESLFLMLIRVVKLLVGGRSRKPACCPCPFPDRHEVEYPEEDKE